MLTFQHIGSDSFGIIKFSIAGWKYIDNDILLLNAPIWRLPIMLQEIAANCEKNIRAKDTQVSLMICSLEFKLVKPFVFL